MERAQTRFQASQTALDELKGKLAGLTIVAPKSGTFTTELKRGATIAAGDVLGAKTGEPIMSAAFEVEDSSKWAVGDEVTIKSKADPNTEQACTVLSAEGKSVSVECMGGLEAGTVVVLP